MRERKNVNLLNISDKLTRNSEYLKPPSYQSSLKSRLCSNTVFFWEIFFHIGKAFVVSFLTKKRGVSLVTFEQRRNIFGYCILGLKEFSEDQIALISLKEYWIYFLHIL